MNAMNAFNKRTPWMLLGLSALCVHLLVGSAQAQSGSTGPCNSNCVTKIILRAKLTGTIAVQSFDSKVQPVVVTKKQTETTFLTSVLGRPPLSVEVLAMEFDLDSIGGTNIHLLVYNTASRTSVTDISDSAQATLLMDGRRGAFNVTAPLRFTSAAFRGGRLQIAGQVKENRNVPSQVKAELRGFIVGPPSVDFGGNSITGLVQRTSIRTLLPPLDVDPPVIPNP